MSMRKLSRGERSACRAIASLKIEDTLKKVEEQTDSPLERAELLKNEFNRRALCNVRTLENFYPGEYQTRIQTLDDDLGRDLIISSLTTVFTLEGLRDKIAVMSQENAAIIPIWKECKNRMREEQKRFYLSYRMFQTKGVLTSETANFITKTMKNLLVKSVPVLEPAKI